MTPAQSLHKQFTQRVLELKNQGLQVSDICDDPEVEQLGLTLWGSKAVKKIIQMEVRRVIQNDIDKETGVRKWVSVPQVTLPMPQASKEPPTPAELRQREYLRTVTLDPIRELITVQELSKAIKSLVRKRGVLTEYEEQSLFKAIDKVFKTATTRLQQSNGSDIVVD